MGNKNLPECVKFDSLCLPDVNPDRVFFTFGTGVKKMLASGAVAFRRLCRDTQGNISMLLGIMLIPILCMVGVAIDLQSVNTSRNFVQYTLDSAVIGGAKELQGGASTQAVTSYINNYISETVDEHSGLNCQAATVSVSSTGTDIDAAVNCSQTTTLTALMGFDTLDFTIDTGTTYGVGEVDLAMVFDVSGSMGWYGRMDDLKDAAEDAVDILIPADGSTDNGDVRIAMVGYASMVDAGETYFEDVTGLEPEREITVTTTQMVQGDCISWYYSWCWQYEYEEEEVEEEFEVDSTCVIERLGDEAYTAAEPDDDQWIEALQPTYNAYWDYWDMDECNDSAQPLPLTDDRDDLKDFIDEMEPDGGTAGHLGIAWGWYMISPDWASVWPTSSTPKPYNDPDTVKAMIIMTDGEFNTWHNSGEGNSFEQAQDLCDEIKATGITIYTVAFDAPTAGEEILAYCASESSFAFTADNGNELKDAYTTIAQNISDLRIAY